MANTLNEGLLHLVQLSVLLLLVFTKFSPNTQVDTCWFYSFTVFRSSLSLELLFKDFVWQAIAKHFAKALGKLWVLYVFPDRVFRLVLFL